MPLNDQSPIASRLYEFFIYNFAARQPQFKIGYERLAASLPVVAERYRSLAEKQLSTALQLNQNFHVIDGFQWTTGVEGQLLLVLHPGPVIAEHQKCFGRRKQKGSGQAYEAAELVRQFYYQLRREEGHLPSDKELEQGKKILSLFAETDPATHIARVVKTMKERGFDCKFIGGSLPYWEEEHRRYLTNKKHRLLEEAKKKQQERDNERWSEERGKRNTDWEEYLHLDVDVQNELLARAQEQTTSDFVQRKIENRELDDPLVRQECLKQLHMAQIE